MADLLSIDDLPEGFDYPAEFIREVEVGLTNLEPWWIFDGALLRQRFAGLRQRFPQRRLIPFARRLDNDDVACWDVDTGDVAVVHDFASPGWEQNSSRFPDFYTWLLQAVKDLIEFDQ